MPGREITKASEVRQISKVSAHQQPERFTPMASEVRQISKVSAHVEDHRTGNFASEVRQISKVSAIPTDVRLRNPLQKYVKSVWSVPEFSAFDPSFQLQMYVNQQGQ